MSELNQLFEKLLHSELSFNNRIEYLKKLKADIQHHQSHLAQLCERSKNLLGELAVKRQTLADAELHAKCATIHEETLEQQKEEQLRERNSLRDKLAQLEEKVDQERMEFMCAAKQFGTEYDMSGLGAKKRQDEARATITMLEEKLDVLKREITDYQKEKDKIATLQKCASSLEEYVRKEKGRTSVLVAGASAQKKEIERLEREKATLSQKHSTDPEIVKLQKELEKYRENCEDTKCEQLGTELSQLQEKYYRQQLEQKSRQHYEKQKEDRLGKNGLIAHYNPYKKQCRGDTQQVMEEPDDILMSVEDEWFETMAAAEEWDNMDIEDDSNTDKSVVCSNTNSSSSGAKIKEDKNKFVEEKDARLVPRVIKKPKKVRFHY